MNNSIKTSEIKSPTGMWLNNNVILEIKEEEVEAYKDGMLFAKFNIKDVKEVEYINSIGIKAITFDNWITCQPILGDDMNGSSNM